MRDEGGKAVSVRLLKPAFIVQPVLALHCVSVMLLSVVQRPVSHGDIPGAV